MGLRLVVCISVMAIAATANAEPETLLLVGTPLIESPVMDGIDIVRSAIERGALEGLSLDAGSPYKQVLSLRAIENEDRYIDPVVKFGRFSKRLLLDEAHNRLASHQNLELKGLISSTFSRSPTGELIVELQLWDLPNWTHSLTKRMGGCGASIEDVAEAAREAASMISRGSRAPSDKATVDPKVGIIPFRPIEYHEDVATATVLAGQPITLDSCATAGHEHDAFRVIWVQSNCSTDPRLCILPRSSVRQRLAVTPELPGIYEFTLSIEDRNGCSHPQTCSKKLKVYAIEPPKAIPIIRDALVTSILPQDGVTASADKQPSAAEHQRAAAAFFAGLENEHGDSVRTIRVRQGGSKRVWLDGRSSRPASINPNEVEYRWEQLEGTSVTLVGDNPAVQYFDARWSQPGSYVFALTITTHGFDDTQRVSFLVAPEIFADAGPDETVDVGEKIRLDNGSYDVLDDSPVFSWAIEQTPTHARILDPSSRVPTFIANEPGLYVVRVFVRARRTQGDRHLWDVATSDKRINVISGRHRITVQGTGVMELDSPKVQPKGRDFLGLCIEYLRRVKPVMFRARTRLGFGRDRASWSAKVDISSVDIGISSSRIPISIFSGMAFIPRDPGQIGPTIGFKFSPQLSDNWSLTVDISTGILFVGDDRPFAALDLGFTYNLK